MQDETGTTGETVADDATWSATLEAARKLGEEYGTDAGSWIVDGNSTGLTLRTVIEASDEGTFFDLFPDLSGPLSGEYADGYSVARLADELGVDEESDGVEDLCSAFEDGYWQGFEDEAVRSARAMLPEHEARPSAYGMPSGVFGMCAEPGCAVPVWREDHPGMGYTSLDEGTWRHVEPEDEDR